MDRILRYSLMLLCAFLLLNCNGSGAKGPVAANSVPLMDSSAFDYPTWFPLGREVSFPNSYVIYFSNPLVPKYLNKDIRISIFEDEDGFVKFRTVIGDRIYEYPVESLRENKGRILLPIQQEYMRMVVRGKEFNLKMQHALDIEDPDLIREEGFFLSLPDEKISASTSYFDAEEGKWGSMLLKN